MASREPRGDYLYLSTREVERLLASLPAPPSVGSFVHGRGRDEPLAGASPATVLKVAAEAETALREQVRVRQVAETDLAAGDWFESSGLPMAYGVQAARRAEDSDASVFVGQIDEHSAGAESSLLLSGSSEYLQDRSVRAEDITGDMSYPSALFALLASLTDRKVADPSVNPDVQLSAEDRRAPAHRRAATPVQQPREEQWLAVGYPIAQAQMSFGRRGLFPLGFLARAVKVVNFESQGLSGRWIVGTPLWVERQLPE
jgi:hypothetical protein